MPELGSLLFEISGIIFVHSVIDSSASLRKLQCVLLDSLLIWIKWKLFFSTNFQSVFYLPRPVLLTWVILLKILTGGSKFFRWNAGAQSIYAGDLQRSHLTWPLPKSKGKWSNALPLAAVPTVLTSRHQSSVLRSISEHRKHTPQLQGPRVMGGEPTAPLCPWTLGSRCKPPGP